MIRSYFIRLMSQAILLFGTSFNGVQHKFYAFFLERTFRYRKKIIYSNLGRSFVLLSPAEIEAMVKDYYHRLSFYLLQSIWTYFGDESKIKEKLVIKNHNIIQQYLDENQNVIVLSAHFGNWELISVVLPTYFTAPVLGVYKPLSSTILEPMVKKCRSRMGLVLVPMKELLPWFTNKERSPFICLLVADQSPPANESGELIDFLNQKTVFYSGANVLKKRYKPKIFYQKIDVIDDVHFLEFIELDEQNTTQQYASLLEDDIIRNPTLWLWSHNRWKHNLG